MILPVVSVRASQTDSESRAKMIYFALALRLPRFGFA